MKFDPFYHPKLYVIECVTPQHYYVGSTAQEALLRRARESSR